MFAVEVVSLAMARTRRCIAQLRLKVDRLQPEPVESVETLPRRFEAAPEPPVGTIAVPDQQRVVSVTMGPSLVRAVAVSYGLRRALRAENRDRISALMRRELRRRRKIRQRAARAAARTAMSPSATPS